MSQLEHYLKKWGLSQPKKIDVESAASEVHIVTMADGRKAALKILVGDGIEGERMGAVALGYFDGHGAVEMYAHDNGAHLLEFVDGPMLRTLVDDGKDDNASKIIAHIVGDIHGVTGKKQPSLVPLKAHFKELFEMAAMADVDQHYQLMAQLADRLLGNSRLAERPLHGDIHHENIMHSSVHGWVLIDPKGVFGDPHYDLANCFNNPPGHEDLVRNFDRINAMADIFARALGYDKQRLIEYACVHAALSASWSHLSGNMPCATSTLENSKRLYREFIAA